VNCSLFKRTDKFTFFINAYNIHRVNFFSVGGWGKEWFPYRPLACKKKLKRFSETHLGKNSSTEKTIQKSKNFLLNFVEGRLWAVEPAEVAGFDFENVSLLFELFRSIFADRSLVFSEVFENILLHSIILFTFISFYHFNLVFCLQSPDLVTNVFCLFVLLSLFFLIFSVSPFHLCQPFSHLFKIFLKHLDNWCHFRGKNVSQFFFSNLAVKMTSSKRIRKFKEYFLNNLVCNRICF